MIKQLRLISLSLLLCAGFSHADETQYEKAYFAGGCFWCMEPPFEKLDGVISAVSGFTGGKEQNPSYKDVAYGRTSHTEAVEITYDPKKVSYQKLLDVFWMQIDPTTPDKQFVDVGPHYRTGIFFTTDEERLLAESSKRKLEKDGIFGAPIVTEITKFNGFWPAEDYHQDYYKKNPIRYNFYRYNSGRDQYLDKIWGDSRVK